MCYLLEFKIFVLIFLLHYEYNIMINFFWIKILDEYITFIIRYCVVRP